jgi:hypothetical protein
MKVLGINNKYIVITTKLLILVLGFLIAVTIGLLTAVLFS